MLNCDVFFSANKMENWDFRFQFVQGRLISALPYYILDTMSTKYSGWEEWLSTKTIWSKQSTFYPWKLFLHYLTPSSSSKRFLDQGQHADFTFHFYECVIASIHVFESFGIDIIFMENKISTAFSILRHKSNTKLQWSTTACRDGLFGMGIDFVNGV